MLRSFAKNFKLEMEKKNERTLFESVCRIYRKNNRTVSSETYDWYDRHFGYLFWKNYNDMDEEEIAKASCAYAGIMKY